jgi:hypothetical protein
LSAQLADLGRLRAECLAGVRGSALRFGAKKLL